MEAEKATPDNVDGFEIARMARLLGVSRSGYYDWVHRQAAGPSPAQQRRSDLTAKIITHHADSDQVYGSPRILADLREAGEQVSAKTVAKLMRQAGIAGISPRGFVPVTTQAGPDPQPVGDLVGRRFDHGQLNRVWTSDITYLATGQGWLYLCAIRDGCSRRVVGWAIEDHLRTDLVEDALPRAVALRGELPDQGRSSTPTVSMGGPVFPGFLTRTPMDPSGCWYPGCPGHPDPHFRLTTCVFPRICRLPGVTW